MGGEALLESHVNLLLNNKGCSIYNEYGPTETTVGSVVKKITPESQQPLIGSPIWNTDLFVLDKNNQLLPKGAAGELCIGGYGVAKGYANQPKITAEKFVTHPFDPSRKIYKTGDLVRWTDEGIMEYLGRIDQQVKIRGYRIEPSDIENKIKTIPRLEQVAVLPIESPQGDLELIAFFKGAVGSMELANLMKTLLPSFMHPAAYIQIEHWPLTVNGKLDKNVLLQQQESTSLINLELALPETYQEQKMVVLWADVLGLEPSRIGLDADFFELGGQSLKAIRLVNRMNRELDMQVSMTDLFSSGTIRSLCKKYPHGIFGKSREAMVKFHTPDTATSKHLFYIPPIIGVPVGPDGFLFGLKDYHTWGFIYTLEEDFIKHCFTKILETAGPDAEITVMGYSSGGNIAFEVVKLLNAAGCQVEQLLLIDSMFKKASIDLNEEYVNQEIKFWTVETEFTKQFFSTDLTYYENLIKSYAGYMAPLVNTGKIDCPIFHLRSTSDKALVIDFGWDTATNKSVKEVNGFGSHEELFFPAFAAENNQILKDFLKLKK
jgi:bacitracin synthase 3